jgi:hypothetical protein
MNFLDGTIAPTSLLSIVTTQIDPSSVMQQLSIYFYGFLSLGARTSNGISISVSFSTTFAIAISANNLNSIQVNYLVLSFVECGTCTNYYYSYNGGCYNQCPSGTIQSGSICVPMVCGGKFMKNNRGQCIPSCGMNQFFNGKTCICNANYNMINGACSNCPMGTVYNFVSSRCDPPCGTFSKYNTKTNDCSCSKSFVLVDRTCTQCPSGTTYNNLTASCSQSNRFCGDHQEYTIAGTC